jgi:hypothetical protein
MWHNQNLKRLHPYISMIIHSTISYEMGWEKKNPYFCRQKLGIMHSQPFSCIKKKLPPFLLTIHLKISTNYQNLKFSITLVSLKNTWIRWERSLIMIVKSFVYWMWKYALSFQHLCFCKVTNYEFNVRNEKRLVPHLTLGELKFTFVPWSKQCCEYIWFAMFKLGFKFLWFGLKLICFCWNQHKNVIMELSFYYQNHNQNNEKTLLNPCLGSLGRQAFLEKLRST